MNLRTGTEGFMIGGKPIGFNLLDFWQFQFSNIYDLQEHIAEFLVAKALGLDEPYNRDGWTLWDIEYRNVKIEVKETGYYYSWQKDGHISEQRTWGITKAFTEYKNPHSEYKRQSDIYVFCLNIGKNEKDSYPLELSNWEFYVVKTKVINEKYNEQKTISLSRIRELTKPIHYNEIQSVIDNIIASGL